jgi:LETM1-like protein.
MKLSLIPQKLFSFYRDGFKSMTVGKKLWIIILIKLFIMFAILKVFFFPNYLNSHFKDEQSKASHVRQELIKRKE